MKHVCTFLLLVVGVIGCGGARAATLPPAPLVDTATNPLDTDTSRYRVPPQLGDGWATAHAREAGFSVAALEGMTEAVRRGEEYRNVHALLIVRDGRLVYEEYFAGEDMRGGERVHLAFGPDTLHSLRSVTKSVVSALVGIAVAHGSIASVDRLLFDLLPEHADLATPDKRAITLRHALDMTAGLEWNERTLYSDTTNSELRMNRSDAPVRYVLQQRVVEPPGASWNYSGGMSQVLAAVVERATANTIHDFARKELFDTLGITRSDWGRFRDGTHRAASGLMLTPRDMAKFGLLYAQRGEWNGRQLLPAEWVDASLSRAAAVTDSLVALGEDAHAEHGYAHQWFHSLYVLPYGKITAHRAVGNGGQRIWIVPEHRLVVVVTAGRYNEVQDSDRLVLDRVLPAALALTESYRFWNERPLRPVAPGEWPEVALSAAERAGYAGEYLYQGEPVHVADRGGRLVMTNFGGAGSGPVTLVPMGNHVFADGRYQDGVLTGVYFPALRVEFVIEDGRAVAFLDRSEEGSVYARAERIR